MVNLDGLNALLEGAADAAYAGSLERLRDEAPERADGARVGSVPAGPLEDRGGDEDRRADQRPPRMAGSGAKEHKSVFLNLADNLFPEILVWTPAARPSSARRSLSILGVPWTDQCSSTGETIQLVGLNTILAGAERYLGRLGTEVADVLRHRRPRATPSPPRSSTASRPTGTAGRR